MMLMYGNRCQVNALGTVKITPIQLPKIDLSGVTNSIDAIGKAITAPITATVNGIKAAVDAKQQAINSVQGAIQSTIDAKSQAAQSLINIPGQIVNAKAQALSGIAGSSKGSSKETRKLGPNKTRKLGPKKSGKNGIKPKRNLKETVRNSSRKTGGAVKKLRTLDKIRKNIRDM